MNKTQNTIEEFIDKTCRDQIWASISSYIATHPRELGFAVFRTKKQNAARLSNMDLKSVTNIRIDEDSLYFNATMICTIELPRSDGRPGRILSKWLTASCEAVITDKLETINIRSVDPWSADAEASIQGVPATRSIVPVISREGLDAEATMFLEKFYPDALQRPMRVPIRQIATDKLHLKIVQGYCLTNDFSVFGQICFSPGTVDVYDPVKCKGKKYNASGGSIFIDAYTYSQRNVGCANNTIAHEVYHWYRHRLYAAVKRILRDENLIACRCPVDMVYPNEKEVWTDEQYMEWQANNLAPRILMPIQTFQRKVDELYVQYNYANAPLKSKVLTRIANELARFYGVSRQSALIRMVQTGYPEAENILQALSAGGQRSYLSVENVFYLYSTDGEFRQLLDTGLFKYVDGYVVVNDAKYIESDETGFPVLTDYALDNLRECALAFGWKKDPRSTQEEILPETVFYRNKKALIFDKEILVAPVPEKEIDEIKRRFDRDNRIQEISINDKSSCWEYVFAIVEKEGIDEETFCKKTMLSKKIFKNVTQKSHQDPSVRIITSIACGLKLDVETVEKMLALAGRAFKNTLEDQAYKFCATVLSGAWSVKKCNAFLDSIGVELLGSGQRL